MHRIALDRAVIGAGGLAGFLLLGLLIAAPGSTGIEVAASAVAVVLGIDALLVASERDVLRLPGWQWILILFFVSGLVWRVRTTMSAQTSPLDAAGLVRVAEVSAVGLFFLGMLRARKVTTGHLLQARAFVPLYLYSLVCIISVVWSVNGSWTLYRSLEYFMGVVLIGALSALPNGSLVARRAINTVWTLYALMLAAAIIELVVIPHRALFAISGVIPFSFQIVYPAVARDGVGHLSGILTLVAIARGASAPPGRRLKWLIALPPLLTILLVSETRSAILGLAVGLALMFVGTRMVIRAMMLVVVSAILIAVFPATVTNARQYALRGQNQEQLSTLSGRINYWHLAEARFHQRPLTGYGAYAGGRFVVARQFTADLSSAHGTWFELLVDTGLWGPLFIGTAVLFVFRMLGRAVWSPRTDARSRWLCIEGLAVMGFLTVRSGFSTTFIWHPAVEFLVLVLLAECVRKGGTQAASQVERGEDPVTYV